ncbi:hypothetical protein Gogos_019921 [Gossypium gossypioides]|uniref:Uncharacterized protein n=1 Tax=Gossypium gossypioides TaxID=34282 RepID=A0A7J9D5D8_GOSGO|nr:hypothetical protein [Gossypium gossypioides]
MHVNVKMTKSRRAKKMVKDKLVRNFVQKFVMLWDYVDEPTLGLDDCFLKGPFKGELLAIVGRDGNYQMYLVAWDSVSDIVDNNLCEAFNSSIAESRFKSIITMLEEIRVNMMTKIVVVKVGNYLVSLFPMLVVLYGILNKILMTTYIGTTTKTHI